VFARQRTSQYQAQGISQVAAHQSIALALDNFSTGSMESLIDVARDVEVVRGDVRNYSVVKESVRGVDIVIHLAALIDVAESMQKPDLYF